MKKKYAATVHEGMMKLFYAELKYLAINTINITAHLSATKKQEKTERIPSLTSPEENNVI